MIYHLSLQAVGILAGALLLLYSLFALIKGDAPTLAARFPRSLAAGVALLSLAAIWSFWLVATMEMGEFSSFRKPMMIALPIAFFLTLKFVNEFLAVRALGMLCLLAAEPLLDAAFFRYESSRLLVTVLAYLLVIAGLFWVATPYMLRDQISWTSRSIARWRAFHSFTLVYALAILGCAFASY